MSRRRLKRYIYEFLTTYYGSKKKYGKALYYLKRMDEIDSLGVYERAFEPMLRLADGDYRAAEALFRQIADETKSSSDPITAYVNRYCRARLAGFAGEYEKQRALDMEAAAIVVPEVVKAYLPI